MFSENVIGRPDVIVIDVIGGRGGERDNGCSRELYGDRRHGRGVEFGKFRLFVRYS